ncbi:peptidoglycan-binding protein [Rhizobium sp. 58]|nr:peptidoglycan-binding protein [Rhizobium sp. 58]
MTGSRSNPPRLGAQSYGDRSSLDALNRTIEGLEARIEGLMGGTVTRDPRQRPAEHEISQRPDPISEILQRQRSLSAGRDRIAIRERVSSRQETAPRQEPIYRPEASPRQEPRRDARTYPEPTTYEDKRYAHEPMRAQKQPAATRPETLHPEALRPDPAMADIANALVGLRQELKKDIADGLSREMNTLRAEIRGITVDAAQDQTLAEDMRGDLQKLADSIGQLGRQASPAQADALRVEFDELRTMIDGLAREDSVRRMEERWTGVEDRLNIFDSSRDDELVALAYRLDELKSQIGGIDSAPAIHALEDKLISVAQAIELLGRHMQPDDRRLASQFSDIDARLDEISRAIVASGRTATPADTAGNARVEGRLADLSRQIDTLAHPLDSGLSARIEALTARVEDLANEEAAVRLEERLDQLSAMMERSQKTAPQPDLTDYLADISAKIDALDQGSVNEALAERLDDLARRIDQLDMLPAGPQIGNEQFARLEDRLTDIAHRLEETQAAPYDDGEVLRSLEAQIANLSSLVSQPREHGPATALPVEFEGRMSALEDYLATSDEYIIEAARQAAEAVMDAYSKTGMGQTASGGADVAAISALSDDLKVLENLSRSSEERTARTFEALHETLVHIAEKLERLEDREFEPAGQRAEAEPAPAFGTREFRDNRPAMPKAAQPVFEVDDDPFAGADFDSHYEDLKRDMQSAPDDADRHTPSRAEVAEAVATTSDRIEPSAPERRPTTPAARTSLIAGLAKRFSGKKGKAVATAQRQTIEPTPSIDPVEAMAPDMANQLLEPGSGVPDVKKILERVRAGQTGRIQASSDAEKADFITAARRAAQLAAEEVDTINRGSNRATAGSIGGAFARHRRPILMAVGAVLLAIMSYPLVSTLIGDDNGVKVAPVAVIEQPEASEETSSKDVEIATPAVDGDVEPLSSLQPQAGDAVPANTATELPVTGQADGIPSEALPAGTELSAPETAQTDAEATTTGPMAAAGNTTLLDPAATPGELTSGFEEPSDAAAATAEAFVPAAQPQADIVVPADVTPPALADAARKGDPLAFFEVGAVYTEGRGLKADLAEAAKWYQKAADAGIAPAQYRLASLYEKGTGVARDLSKAKILYAQAAEQGNASAMHNLAVLMASGGEGSPDFAAAGQWFAKAADLGVRDSQFNLAILYARGNGVKQDLEESYKWFAIAARDGDSDAGQKRDEVAAAMRPEQLTSAKAKFEAWKVQPLDGKANAAEVPDSWVGKGVKTSSVDMKKAVRNIQAILNNNGFDAGKPDGALGKKTVTAIKAFQKSIGEEPTGEITDALVKELLKRNAQ